MDESHIFQISHAHFNEIEISTNLGLEEGVKKQVEEKIPKSVMYEEASKVFSLYKKTNDLKV